MSTSSGHIWQTSDHRVSRQVYIWSHPNSSEVDVLKNGGGKHRPIQRQSMVLCLQTNLRRLYGLILSFWLVILVILPRVNKEGYATLRLRSTSSQSQTFKSPFGCWFLCCLCAIENGRCVWSFQYFIGHFRGMCMFVCIIGPRVHNYRVIGRCSGCFFWILSISAAEREATLYHQTNTLSLGIFQELLFNWSKCMYLWK